MKWILVLVLATGPNATPDRIVEQGAYPSIDRCLEEAHAQRKFDPDIRGAWCYPR